MNLLSYEIKYARTGDRVPVVNGVQLHSLYDPIKEAKIAVLRYKELLVANPRVLILGLGFAYHVNAVVDVLKSIHGANYQVSVVEPNINVVQDVLGHSLVHDENIKLYPYPDVEKLYAQKEFIDFLIQRPAIIPHITSTNLYEQFFNDFLDYKAPETMDTYSRLISNEKLASYLQSFESGLDLRESFDLVRRKEVRSDMDSYFLAFEELVGERRV